ncbi:MAG: FeoA family protein [Candidatus Hodarchaeales archaeon]
MMKKLSELAIEKRARIIEVKESEIRKNLLELGFLPGTLITRLRTAPMTDPIEFRIRGFSVSLRKCDADLIIVEVVD